MIARLWRGVTPEAKSEAYLDYLQETGVKVCRATPGSRGVFVLRRLRPGGAEFLFVSLWESMEAIRRFAGPEVEKAVYYPADAEYLLEMEPGVAHYEVLVGQEPGR
jgi:heme-degrading monooxygenase HmoA